MVGFGHYELGCVSDSVDRSWAWSLPQSPV